MDGARASAGDRRAVQRAASDGPFVAVVGGPSLQETKAITKFLVRGLLHLADLNKVVLPPVRLVALLVRQVSCPGHEEDDRSNQATSHQVHGVVVAQIHGRPPQPADVEDEESLESREAVDHEQGLDRRVSSVQTGESTKGHGRS